MAFPNSTYTDIVTTTLESRSKVIQDNVTDNNALLAKLKKKGKVKPFSGGRTIVEPISFAENSNGGWYNGYDTLPTAAADVISAAEYSIKQYAVPVTISGLEELQNSGEEAELDLLEGRMGVAEATMQNAISVGLYGDGTASGGKAITGLDAAVPTDPTTGTYGGINRATASNTFWRSKINNVTVSATDILGDMNELWASLVRGADRPDLIVMDNLAWAIFMGVLQPLQRFENAEMANLGFSNVQFMSAPVVLDGGIGGAATSTTIYMLNTSYLHFRPHSKRNMVPLNPEKRYATNQDASVSILAWAGNLTCSGAQFQGRMF